MGIGGAHGDGRVVGRIVSDHDPRVSRWPLLVVLAAAVVLVCAAVSGQAGAVAIGAVIGALLVAPAFLLNRARWSRARAVLGADVVRCVACCPELQFGYLVLDDQHLSLYGAEFALVGSWPLDGLTVFPDVPVPTVGTSRARRGFRVDSQPPVDLVCMGTSGWISRRDSEVFVRRLAARGVRMQP